jgi:hypothetical protein
MLGRYPRASSVSMSRATTAAIVFVDAPAGRAAPVQAER